MDAGGGAAAPFVVIVPARYASTRLPGKPLADVGGRPLVVRVADRARECAPVRLVVATDDERIRDVVVAHGHEACMTRGDHPTGSDRLAEAADLLNLSDDAIVVNVQGDEPLLDPALIREVAALLARTPPAAIATACHPLASADDLFEPNVVKVVLDADRFALYFSRAPIPWAREAFARLAPGVGGARVGEAAAGAGGCVVGALPPGLPAYRHYGLYAYRRSFLRVFPGLAVAPLEQAESLEQLRALWHGHRIVVAIAGGAPAIGVDTPGDLERVRAFFARSPGPALAQRV